MSAVVVDQVHRHRDFQCGVPPRLAGLLLHDSDQVVFVVQDPVQEIAHVNGAAVGSERLPRRLGGAQLFGRSSHTGCPEVGDMADDAAIGGTAHLDVGTTRLRDAVALD